MARCERGTKDRTSVHRRSEIESTEELTNCSGYVESRFDEKLGWSTDYLSVLNDDPDVTFEVKKWAYIADLLPHGDEYTKDNPKTQKI